MKGSELYQYPFTPKRITVEGGYALSCVDEGEGEPLVFVHGNPSWSYLYRNLISSFSPSYRCIAPDHIGCGLSEKPQSYPYRLADHIDNLEQVLDILQVKSCTLVMHDWGGAIGMGWAGRYPDRVKRLVVMNTAAFRSRLIPFRISVCRWPLLGTLLVRGCNAFAGAAIHMAVTQKMTTEVAQGFLYPYDSWANRVAILRFVEDIPLQENHPSWQTLVQVEDGLQKLQDIPMLICWGGKDFCFHEAFFKEWQRRFPGAESHYFGQAGHYLLEDALDPVREEIARFLSENTSEQ